ncbi:MAG: CBS domain-containing protein, partial [Gammaproteobacteria bacterium]|nr:CBS domain-containing protein [Gammaproteobacteria bacterium]
MLNVAQLMTQKPVSVSPDDSLAVVKQIFDHVKFHHVLVVEQGMLLGVLSDRDLFKALSPHIGTAAETPRDLATLNKKVHQVMRRKPVTLQPLAKVMDAIQLFNSEGVSCIP